MIGGDCDGHQYLSEAALLGKFAKDVDQLLVAPGRQVLLDAAAVTDITRSHTVVHLSSGSL